MDMKKCTSKEHNEANAISFCQICDIYLCNKCEKIHRNLCSHHIKYNISYKRGEVFNGNCQEKKQKILSDGSQVNMPIKYSNENGEIIREIIPLFVKEEFFFCTAPAQKSFEVDGSEIPESSLGNQALILI